MKAKKDVAKEQIRERLAEAGVDKDDTGKPLRRPKAGSKTELALNSAQNGPNDTALDIFETRTIQHLLLWYMKSTKKIPEI
jgi:hypothetical protein